MDDIVKEAVEAFAAAEAHESDNRAAALDDLRFARLGGAWQWPDKVRRQREAEGRPCLTINRMPSFIRQVVNDSRQNKPAISVHPVERGDAKTAEVMSGLIRNIETMSNADIAYDTAVDCSATMGFGYIRINLDYATDDGFEKDLVIRPVPNPFAIYGDPFAQSSDGSDWSSAFVIEQMSETHYARRFPTAETIDFSSSAWSGSSGWLDGQERSVRVAEYWKREEVVRQLVQYARPDGAIAVAHVDELPRLRALLGPIETIGQPRPVKSFEVTQYVLNGSHLLSEQAWPGRFIPIVPVYGEEVNVEGRRHFRSLIRDARDPQQMFNYWRTMATELVALAPKAPWVGRRGAFASDPRWATANNATHAFLEYDGPEPPMRQPFTGVPAGELQAAMNAADDMKAVMGLYDASLGARSNETSGRAILARQREGDVATFHFIDNLSRAIRQTGRILIDLIPKVYNSDRMIRVLGQDGKAAMVRITDPDGAPDPAADIYNLTIGKYDLTVKAGPSYSTQREEAATMLTELVRANPQSASLLGDLIVENLDLPGGEKVIRRLQAILPDAVRQAEQGQDPAREATARQVEQLRQALEQLGGRLQAAEADRQREDRQLDIAAYKAVTDRLAAVAGQLPAELLQMLVVETLQDVAQTAAAVPAEGPPVNGGLQSEAGFGASL
ncbi:portal protein [Rhizorhabdus sp. FW153]|uniref:portal protein n=1 Tax=Rhizorhabdus sp. FW153 TaxID=3400216 RepID=UPI003CED07A8